MSDKVFVGQMAASLGTAPTLAAYTGVRLWYDDESCYFVGDETGRVLEADCPWATRAMANSVLASIQGFVYQPFEAGTALLDMEAELGDGVTVGGVYGQLAFTNTMFDGLCASDIGAPSDEEVDHEYPFQTRQQREMKRKVSLGKSYYGTRITRQHGLEIIKTAADGTETARVRLNSDELAFYDDDGAEALYFDAAAGKYRFRGDVEVTGYISGDIIRTLGSFAVGYDSGEFTPTGFIGPAYGRDAAETTTYGIAMTDAETASVDDGIITQDSHGRYAIITNKGVRLQAFYNNIALTQNNIYLSIRDASDVRKKWINLSSEGAFYNGDSSKPLTEIATKGDLAHIDSVYGALQVLNADDEVTGWVGSGSGQATDGSLTFGVAMAASTTPILGDGGYSLDFDSEGRYILVTSEGIKLKSGENTRITLTDRVISIRALNGAALNYNGSEVVTVAMLRSYGLIA